MNNCKFAKKICMMKRLFTLLMLLCFAASVNAQIAPDKYWVQFKDKEGSPYSINNPEEFLSERAIQRRSDYNIAIDEYDIPVNPSYLKTISDIGATILHPSKWLNGVSIQTSSQYIVSAIEMLPFVVNVRALENDDVKQQIKEKTFFSNEYVEETVMMDDRSYYGAAYPQINQLNGIALHEMGYQGQGMWIGICDGGFDYVDRHEVFEDMYNSGRLLGTRDFVYKNGVVYTDSSHGTSCLSLMAANIPNKYVGTAPLASYFLCRTEDVNSENVIEEYNWVSAAEFLDSLGVDVISTSLGYITFDDPRWDHVYEDLDGETSVITIGSEIAASRGILSVVSAGNEGGSDFPYISVPADGNNTLTVGAVGADGQRAYFSSVGPTYDGRTKPDVMAHGYGVTVATPGEGSYYDGSGTSYSCPVIAGMVACLWQANKYLPASAIRDALRQNSSSYSNPDNEYGYGIPDFLAALETLFLEEKSDFVINSPVFIYPNPSNGKVDVELEIDAKANVKIYDVAGKLLYDNDILVGEEQVLSAFLSDLNQGLYFVNLIENDKNFVTKLIKY